MKVSRLVTIGWFTEPWNAYIAQGRLQAEGVASWIIHEHHIWANWMSSNALGQVKLQVLERDVEQGTAVLQQLWRGEFERELQQEFGPLEQNKCPHCGSEEVYGHVSAFQSVLAFAVYGILGVAYPPRKNLLRCMRCQHDRAVPL